MRSNLLLALLLFAPSCKGDSTENRQTKSADETPKASTTVSPECAAQTAELATWMKTGAEEQDAWTANHAFPAGERVELADEPVPVAGQGPIVVVRNGAFEVNGTLVAPIADPAAQKLVFEHLRAAKKDDTSLTVDLEASAPWGALTTISGAAKMADIPRLEILFAAKSRVMPPPDSPLAQQFRAMAKEPDPSRKALPIDDPSAKPTTSADEVFAVFDACPAVRDLLKPSATIAVLAEKLPEAAKACNCNVDDAHLRAAYWAGLGRYFPGTPLTKIVVEPTDEADVRIEQPADAPWSTSHAALVEAAKKNPRLTLSAAPADKKN